MTLALDHDRLEPRGPGAAVPADAGSEPAPRLRFWRQVLLVLVFYAGYTLVRGQFGSASASAGQAAANASTIMALEARLGIGNELALQQWFLQWPAAVRAVNVFYGLFHFVAPVLALVALFRWAPARYRRWRDTLAAATALALVGFSLFPLMPPRLLCDCPHGAGVESGFVDTLARYGGLWSFGSHGVGAVSNQYAAMPSLHFAWALWCALAAAALLRPRWRGARVALLYPALTLVAIVVTANHFWLDAAGGAVVLAVGAAIARGIERARGRAREAFLGRRHRAEPRSPTTNTELVGIAPGDGAGSPHRA